MLDDYSLRLLAEIGIDVYVPRAEVVAIANAPVAHQLAAGNERATTSVAATVERVPQRDVAIHAEFLIVCTEDRENRLLGDLLRGLRMAGLNAAIVDIGQVGIIAAARGLLILGESLVRALGADIPAQRQNEIAWIISSELTVLAQSAAAKRSLWGEIKRLSRAQTDRRPHP